MTSNEVLVVSPSTGASDTLADILGGAWNVYPAQSVNEAVGHLSSRHIPVVNCESSLPDGNWKLLLESAPNLIVTARGADEALWAEVLNQGGYDVLAQPFDKGEVTRVVASASRRVVA